MARAKTSAKSAARTNAEITAETRARLIQAARRVFARDGYADTTGDALAEAAGLTRGAVYYQFGGKEGLFAACADAAARELVQRIFVETMKDTPPEVQELAIGGGLLLDAFSEPEIATILLRDAPGVLGWPAWMCLMEEAGLVGLIDHALGHWADAGLIAPGQVRPVARLLFGAVIQAAQAIATADDPQRTTEDYRASITWMIAGLKGR